MKLQKSQADTRHAHSDLVVIRAVLVEVITAKQLVALTSEWFEPGWGYLCSTNSGQFHRSQTQSICND